MPELPEVQTTVNGLNKKVKEFKITQVWSSYNSSYYKSKENIKNLAFFDEFKSRITGATILKSERRGKNILIHLNNNETILIHMKMTGHLMFGEYVFSNNKMDEKDPWKPQNPKNKALNDPFNRNIRFVLSLEKDGANVNAGAKNTNKTTKKVAGAEKHLVLSDTRKFAKITVHKSNTANHSPDLSHLGPEPLDKSFDFNVFKKQIFKKPTGKIKTVLLDQTIIAGIGNIYSDESLWLAGIHPERLVKNIKENELKKLYQSVILVLKHGIDFGGDSMSDYRNIDGEKGGFQERHNVYRKNKEKCGKRGCEGFIKRIVVGGRGTHLCDKHQV